MAAVDPAHVSIKGEGAVEIGDVIEGEVDGADGNDAHGLLFRRRMARPGIAWQSRLPGKWEASGDGIVEIAVTRSCGERLYGNW